MSSLAGVRSGMSGYWRSSFFEFYPDRSEVEVKKKNAKKNEANVQLSRSNKLGQYGIVIWPKKNFFLRGEHKINTRNPIRTQVLLHLARLQIQSRDNIILLSAKSKHSSMAK